MTSCTADLHDYIDDLPPPRTVVDPLEIPDDPSQVFDAVVTTGIVCGHCYRLLRRREALPYALGDRHADIMANVETHLPDGHDHDLLDREFWQRVDIPDRVPRDTGAVGNVSYCHHCGCVDHHRPEADPRPKRDLLRVAANLSVTYAELGVAHDRCDLIRSVDAMASRPHLSGREATILRWATWLAVRRARLDTTHATTLEAFIDE